MYSLYNEYMQAREYEQSGEDEMATYYRKQARNCNIAGIIGGAVAIVLAIIIVIITIVITSSLYSSDD